MLGDREWKSIGNWQALNDPVQHVDWPFICRTLFEMFTRHHLRFPSRLWLQMSCENKQSLLQQFWCAHAQWISRISAHSDRSYVHEIINRRYSVSVLLGILHLFLLKILKMESNFEPCCSKTEPRNHHRFVRYADQEPNEPKCCEKPNEDFNLRKEMAEPMRPIGPWATGCPDWNPKNGLTGVTPVGEHYSMTRFSTNEWRQRNSDVLSESHRTFNKSIKCEEECKSMMARTHAFVDANQDDTTKRLKSRTHDVHKWQTTLTRAIKSMFEEISSLEEERLRIIRAMSILQMPESIGECQGMFKVSFFFKFWPLLFLATECIDRRCFRADSELVRDEVQEELIEEIALISEIRNVLKNTLKDIADHQVWDASHLISFKPIPFNNLQIANRTSRERLENDWSDKKDAFEIDTINCGLNNRSDVTLFRPGVTRYMNELAHALQCWSFQL